MIHGHIHVICQYDKLVNIIAMGWITFNDGLWHQLQLLQKGERLILQLDDGKNVASAIVNGAFRIEDMQSGYILLGTSALQPTDSPLSTFIRAKDFKGCMQDFAINYNLMSPWGESTQSSAYMKNIEKECLSVDLCQSQPCPSNHSVCRCTSHWITFQEGNKTS